MHSSLLRYTVAVVSPPLALAAGQADAAALTPVLTVQPVAVDMMHAVLGMRPL